MPRRPQTWVVSEHENGEWSVWRGNRPVATGLHHQGHAIEIVRRHRASGEKVYLAESDGYRTDRTKEFAAADVVDQRKTREQRLVLSRARLRRR